MSSKEQPEGKSRELSERTFESPDIVMAKSGRLVLGTEAFMRPENQDQLFVDLGKDAFGVIDGMGGYMYGSEAAACVKQALVEGVAEGKSPWDMQRNAHKLMVEHGIREGGAVYVAGVIEKKKLKVWYAGDADLRVFDSKGKLKFRTSGRDLAMAPRGKYPGKDTVEYAYLSNYDRILVASDGLWDNIVEEEAIAQSKDLPLPGALLKLVELARSGMTEGITY